MYRTKMFIDFLSNKSLAKTNRIFLEKILENNKGLIKYNIITIEEFKTLNSHNKHIKNKNTEFNLNDYETKMSERHANCYYRG